MSDLLTNLDTILETEQRDFTFTGPGDVEEIASILGQSDYNNIIYVGQSGVGKTANIYGLAQAQNEDPETSDITLPLHMVSREFFLMNLGQTFTGGEEKIRENIQKIFTELKRPGCNVLVIEDANDFLTALDDHSVPGIIPAFMTEMRKGSFQCIWMVREVPGTTTKLSAVLECHSEIEELFTILRKEPAEHDEIINIVRDRSKILEKHHKGLTIVEEASDEIVELTLAYPSLAIYQREQPARALRMIDSIASRFVTDSTRKNGETPEWIKAVRSLQKLNRDKNEAESLKEQNQKILDEKTEELREYLRSELDKEPNKMDISSHKTPEMREAASSLRVINEEISDKIMPAISEVKNEIAFDLTLDMNTVRAIFGEISGIPAGDLSDTESEKIVNLEPRMLEYVYGQNDAVGVLAGAIKRARAGLKEPNQPVGGFIMLGSSGVGKTYVGEILAKVLFDDKENMTTFDMSEFMEKHTVSKLIGAPPGYAGYGAGGALINAVRERPYQVILLDEIEKAHPDVFKVLLQVLDKGRLSDELGTGDFSNTIILMTTNLAQHLSLDESVDPLAESTRELVIEELRTIFPQELINRVDDFLLFRALLTEHIEKILLRQIRTLNKRLAKNTEISVVLSDENIAQIVADRYKREEGARQVKKFISNKLDRMIADYVFAHPEGGKIVANYTGETFELNFEAN